MTIATIGRLMKKRASRAPSTLPGVGDAGGFSAASGTYGFDGLSRRCEPSGALGHDALTGLDPVQ